MPTWTLCGRAYRPFLGQYREPERAIHEEWLRFDLPAGDTGIGVRHLSVQVDHLSRQIDPLPSIDLDDDQAVLSEAIPGRWSFEFDLDFLPGPLAHPDVTATVGDVSVSVVEWQVTPVVTIGTLTFSGLPRVEWGWDPYFTVDRGGSPVKVEVMHPGSVQDALRFEASPGFDDLSGTWTITIDEFHRDIPDPDSDITTEEESIVGPWVLTFEGPPADAP